MNSFSDNFIVSSYVQDQDNNIIFNTYIGYDEYSVLVDRGILIDVIELVFIGNFSISIFLVNWMKRKMIRENVYKMKVHYLDCQKLEKLYLNDSLCPLWDFWSLSVVWK